MGYLKPWVSCPSKVTNGADDIWATKKNPLYWLVNKVPFKWLIKKSPRNWVGLHPPKQQGVFFSAPLATHPHLFPSPLEILCPGFRLSPHLCHKMKAWEHVRSLSFRRGRRRTKTKRLGFGQQKTHVDSWSAKDQCMSYLHAFRYNSTGTCM